jgi:hypothetical protein
MSDIVERLLEPSPKLLTGQWLREMDALRFAAADEIQRLRQELAEARRKAMEECATLIEEGYDRIGIASKRDTCDHAKFGWEDCDQCAAAAIRALDKEGKG